ncbi:hypothetical protein [Candidatus Nanohalobium constans]|nr:hypothetical protein [Candidatus Nanohalobium constans]
MKKRKGDVNGTRFLVEVILAIAALTLALYFIPEWLQNAKEATQGCTILQSVVADATQGAINSC